MQQTAITLNLLTYQPAGTDAGKSKWVERSSGVGTGFSVLTEKFYPVSKSGVQRIEHNLNVPVVATVDSACSCVGSVLYSSYANVNIGIGPGASAAHRLDLYNRIKDYVASDAFKLAITDLDPAYG